MNKVLVLGISGAGKSTLTKQLGNFYNINYLHLDKIYWQPNWMVTDENEFTKKHLQFMKQDNWIIDGSHGYGAQLEERFKAADTVIYLRYNRFRAYARAVKRYFKYRNQSRDSITEGCVEKMDFEFSKYILWDFYKKKDRKIKKLIKNYPNKKIYIFSNPKKTNAFLKEIGVEQKT